MLAQVSQRPKHNNNYIVADCFGPFHLMLTRFSNQIGGTFLAALLSIFFIKVKNLSFFINFMVFLLG
jgi:hypothetical protein